MFTNLIYLDNSIRDAAENLGRSCNFFLFIGFGGCGGSNGFRRAKPEFVTQGIGKE